MVLGFTDRQGSSGTVTDDLEVRYDGPWKDEVKDRVERLEREFRTGEDLDLQTIVQELLLDTPEHVPIIEVHRQDIRE